MNFLEKSEKFIVSSSKKGVLVRLQGELGMIEGRRKIDGDYRVLREIL